MKNRTRPENFSNLEAMRLALPVTAATVFLLLIMLVYGVWQSFTQRVVIANAFWLGLWGMVYAGIIFGLMRFRPRLVWHWRYFFLLINSLTAGLSFGIINAPLESLPHVLVVFIAVISVLFWGLNYARIFIGVSALLHFVLYLPYHPNLAILFFEHTSMALLALAVSEGIHRLLEAANQRVTRLERLNEFARRIGASIEKEQVIAVVQEALKEWLQADTYFLGILVEQEIHLAFLYDAGKLYEGSIISAQGTLSGWVVKHKQPLFMSDLRQDVSLDGVSLVIVGDERTNLSWMGMPMLTAHMNGILAVGSYAPNAFDRADMELLENLAQQAALALDNALHHAEVEKQSQRDSLTGVYNHGYFLHLLEEQARQSRKSSQPLSLIMLDIDYFKQYNDTYGHLTGDLVLVEVTAILRAYIKATDSLGRWGGEEFVLLLPNASGPQALQIAQRIRAKINTSHLKLSDGREISLPTLSQGIAVFPAETEDIIRLVDMADQRLYLAKKHGRDQIEPSAAHWNYLQA